MTKKEEKVNLEKLKLQVEIAKHLLRYRFTWEEIFEAIGFSEDWLIRTEQLIKEYERNPNNRDKTESQ